MKFESTKSMPEEINHERHDRHLRLAAKLAAQSRDAVQDKFTRQRVMLTGDTERLRVSSGRLMLRVAANLIARFCPKIDIVLPAEFADFQAQLITMLRKIDSSADAEFRAAADPIDDEYAAVLSVARSLPATKSSTVIDAEGWLAIVGNRPSIRESPRHHDKNPFGALMAAALGAAEVFKDLLKPPPGKAFHFGDQTFSTFDYSIGGTDPGPDFPGRTSIPDALLAGVGAVGNAFLLSISEFPELEGTLLVLDQEAVDDPSNLNRYLLAFEADADPERPTPKTELAVRLFKGTNIRVRPFQEDISKRNSGARSRFECCR
jgi:hypothetical protein